jgi:hypothetical protein
MRRRKTGRFTALVVNVGVLALTLVILLAGLEVGFAVLQINTKSNVRFIPDKGVTRIPNAYYCHTKEGFSEGYYNSHGFRDYERSYEKPPNTFRIMVLGDSYVEALEVALADAFPALLERTLNESSASMRFEVLAMGESGFGTADEYMRYLNFGVDYAPDLVLVAFLTGNDIRNNSKSLNQENLAFYFGFDHDKHLILDRSIFDVYQRSMTLPKRIFKSIKQHSYVASFLSERMFLLNRQLQEEHFKARFGASAEAGDKAKLDEISDLNIYLRELSPRWQEAFDITKAIILKFRDSVEEHGARFVLVTLSNAEQVHPRQAERLKAKYGLEFDYEQPDRIVADFARQNGIFLLQLMPVFRDHHLKTGTRLHGFGGGERGHWNEHGHRLAAQEMFRYLKEQHLVPLD